jgi:uncharacterized protein YbdZ (MbtH family)
MTHFAGSIDNHENFAALLRWIQDAGQWSLWRAIHFAPKRFEVRGAVVVCGATAHDQLCDYTNMVWRA